jgi:hypothetical protein
MTSTVDYIGYICAHSDMITMENAYVTIRGMRQDQWKPKSLNFWNVSPPNIRKVRIIDDRTLVFNICESQFAHELCDASILLPPPSPVHVTQYWPLAHHTADEERPVHLTIVLSNTSVKIEIEDFRSNMEQDYYGALQTFTIEGPYRQACVAAIQSVMAERHIDEISGD